MAPRKKSPPKPPPAYTRSANDPARRTAGTQTSRSHAGGVGADYNDRNRREQAKRKRGGK